MADDKYQKHEEFTRKLENIKDDSAVSKLKGMLFKAAYSCWEANLDENTYVAKLDETKQAALADKLYGITAEHMASYFGVSKEGIEQLKKPSNFEGYTTLEFICKQVYKLGKNEFKNFVKNNDTLTQETLTSIALPLYNKHVSLNKMNLYDEHFKNITPETLKEFNDYVTTELAGFGIKNKWNNPIEAHQKLLMARAQSRNAAASIAAGAGSGAPGGDEEQE